METLDAVTGQVDLSGGDERRFERMYNGVQHGVLDVFGDRYRIHSEQYGASANQLLITENGYLDVAIRTGSMGFVVFLMLVFSSAVVLKRELRRLLHSTHVGGRRFSDLPIAVALYAGFVGVFAVGNIFLNLATEPYVSPFFWCLLGIVDLIRLNSGSNRLTLNNSVPKGAR
jgi:hypothetical protein